MIEYLLGAMVVLVTGIAMLVWGVLIHVLTGILRKPGVRCKRTKHNNTVDDKHDYTAIYEAATEIRKFCQKEELIDFGTERAIRAILRKHIRGE